MESKKQILAGLSMARAAANISHVLYNIIDKVQWQLWCDVM